MSISANVSENKKENRHIRVRFAPSPTGHLHIGSVRAALFNWLFARHNDGVFLVRIEDTDLERSKKEYTDSIIASLDWLRIQPDETIIIQSERMQEHKQIIKELLDQGKAYKCYCTQDDMKERAQDNAFITYDGACRPSSKKLTSSLESSVAHSLRVSPDNKPYVVRFKIPDIKEVAFDDLIRGRIVIDRDQLDDFIIARSDGRPTYNFVVVVDDAHMNITQVIRGEDHISNTPKQILLYQACGYDVPEFAHLPLILGPSGDRLSKRDAATSVLEYKSQGYLPDALINYLVRLGWAHGDQEIFTREELINLFTLKAVGKKGAIFDVQKLQWLNGIYIREMNSKDIIAYIEKEMVPGFSALFPDWSKNQLEAAIVLYKERAPTLGILIEELKLFYNGPQEYNQDDLKRWIGPNSGKYLTQVIALFESTKEIKCAAALKKLSQDLGIKMVDLMQPIRIALIGKSTGPGVCALLECLDKERRIERIRALYETIQSSSEQ